MNKVKNKYRSNPKLGAWLKNSTPTIRHALSRLAGTSETMFRQWVSGRRNISADMAGRLETAMSDLHELGETDLQPLSRGNLCDACRRCDYFLTDRKGELTEDE
jgi:hypothetical protein